MLLSDRELRSALADGRLRLDPLDEGMVQPASIDVRLDRYFRVFANHRYTHIDPSTEQDDLTEVIEPKGDEPFVLHPGEFVLGSTLEVISLADDLASRLEGKALACDTPIWTPAGRSTMGELKPGDSVFDEQGRPTAVLAVSEVMLGRPCYEVITRHGARIVADAQHRWVTSTKQQRVRRRGETSIRTTAELAATVRHAQNELNHHIEIGGAWQLPDVGLPVDPYVFGVWLGDGTSTTADVTSADQEVLDHIAAAGYAVEARGGYRYRIGSPHADRRDAITGRYSSDGSLQGVFRSMGVLGHKHVPAPYLSASAAQRLALLQGLMDSDGYIDDVGRCEFVSTEEALAEATAILAASLGLRVSRRKKRAMLNGVDCGPAYQVKFVPHIPVFRLTRKLARIPAHRLHRHHAIQEVRPFASVPVRCIEVANPRGMFLAGDECVPTHNSSLGRLGLLTHSTAGFIDPGFSGHVTLELSNVANLPITLWPGMKIGQICVFQLSSPSEHPYGSAIYGSRYQGQRGPTPSRSYKTFHRTHVPPAE